MFPDWMTARVRFLRFDAAVPCAECGRRSKHHWTMLCMFQAHTMAQIVPSKSGKEHAPLTAVCRSHLLAPQIMKSQRPPREIEVKL